RDTWEITLVKTGDPDARSPQMGMTFKELADQEAEALFKDKTFYRGTRAAFKQLSLEKAAAGIWFTNDKAEADAFRDKHGLGESPQTIQASLHPKSPLIHELSSQQFDFSQEMPRLIELAKQNGHDVIYIKNAIKILHTHNLKLIDHIYVMHDAVIKPA